ncbi:autotransporter outer membrane beta-barrel domain-containing protein [Pontiellaceae bacterium B1224]|nr:autotransporter outer membrane beta-barrel domain-containing protein [Pontiellaceae bacterium B1224]
MKNHLVAFFSTAIALSAATMGSDLYAATQLPDTAESSVNLSRLINRQLAARNTEYRSMSEFASDAPQAEKIFQPMGVAGPADQKEKSLQGWVRAYGGNASRDASGNYSAYDSGNWGALIGIDKSFGNLLIGLAGGYARADLDSDSDNANIDTIYGSIYSTVGGEHLFVDLALTYGTSDTKESNLSMDDAEFSSDLISLYAGSGWRFEITDKILLTPDAALLMTYYEQEGYALSASTVSDYDTTSLQGALGVNVSTIHQIDWLSQGLAFIPELRLHYIHEFEADQDDFTFTSGGISDSIAVRPLVENMAHIGLGFDFWSWEYQNTKFEVDYDGLFSDGYTEQILSGKITVRF